MQGFFPLSSEVKARQCVICTVFVKLNKLSYSSVALSFYIEKAFAFTTQNLRKPQMALEVKPQTCLSVNNIKNTNKQAKKTKTDWPQQIYVHIHVKKRAVSGVWVRVGECRMKGPGAK